MLHLYSICLNKYTYYLKHRGETYTQCFNQLPYLILNFYLA